MLILILLSLVVTRFCDAHMQDHFYLQTIKSLHDDQCIVVHSNDIAAIMDKVVDTLRTSDKITELWFVVGMDKFHQKIGLPIKLKSPYCLMIVTEDPRILRFESLYSGKRLSQKVGALVSKKVFDNVDPLPSSWWVLIVERSQERHKIFLHQQCPYSELEIKLNMFNTNKGYFLPKTNIRCRNKQALKGKVLQITISDKDDYPWIVGNDQSQQSIVPPWLRSARSVFGVDYFIMETLAQTLGFKLNWSRSNDQENDFMFKAGSVSITEENYQQTDFTSFVYQKEIVLASAKSRDNDPYFKLIYPYNASVWIGIGIIAIVVAMTLLMIYKISLQKPRLDKIKSPGVVDLVKSPTFFIQRHSQSWIRKKHDISSGAYFILGGWLLCGAFLIANYKGNLKASLIVGDFVSKITSVKDFINIMDGQVVIPNSLIQEMAQSQDETKRTLVSKAKPSTLTSMLESDILINASGFALESSQYAKLVDEYFNTNRDLPFYEIEEKVQSQFYGFAMSRTLRRQLEIVNAVMGRLSDSGIMSQFQRSLLKFDRDNLKSTQRKPRRKLLDLTSIALIFQCWAIIMALSTVVFALEFVFYQITEFGFFWRGDSLKTDPQVIHVKSIA